MSAENLITNYIAKYSKYKIELELTPLGCHGRNVAEVGIRNFKAHF